jgi:hypothetical protein
MSSEESPPVNILRMLRISSRVPKALMQFINCFYKDEFRRISTCEYSKNA